MIKYLVFDGSKYIPCPTESDALSLRDQLSNSHRNIVANFAADRAERHSTYALDYAAANAVSEAPVRYSYTVHNLDTSQDYAMVFYGILNGKLVLIRTENGIVTEKYYAGIEVNGKVRDYVTYDENGTPYEYYEVSNLLMTKYSASTNEPIVTTQFGELPTGKSAGKVVPEGRPVAWSEKPRGLVFEYRKSPNTQSDKYMEEFSKVFAESLEEAKSRFPITVVTTDVVTGNETWSAYTP